MKRLYLFVLFIFLFAIFLFAVTCKKEYSYEGGSIAEYALVGSPQHCTKPIVNGNYYKDIIADSSNSIVLLVDVTKTGKYDMQTNALNGISFSASGNFADTCSQCELLLKCNGTPDSVGTFTFHIPGTTGCYFSITVADQPSAKYTLSGEPNDCTNPVQQGTYSKGIAMTAVNVININVDVIEKGDYTITTNTVNGISFSGSGTFTSTGTQQVILQATGTPQIPELSLFILQGGASQCNFYVGVANTDPVATYVLQSGIQNGSLYCSPGSVQGAYNAGTELTGSNTLTVNAYVTQPGNFTISTEQMNGMKFSYTGTFANTGAQNVVLTGKGTPAASGTFHFVPQIIGPAPLGGSTCGLDVVVQ